jgi:RING-like zinc finger
LAGGSDDNKVLGDNGNCAICLEDYVPTDVCTKLPRCLHFYHKDCVKVIPPFPLMMQAIDRFLLGMAKNGKNLSGLSRECGRTSKSQRQLSSITCSVLRGAEGKPGSGSAVSQRHKWGWAGYHPCPTSP